MKKIMFSDKFGLTEAVWSGRKTMTRRIVKFSDIDAKYLYDEEWNVGGYVLETIIDRYARYKVGEVVAVAQSYKDCGYDSDALDRSPKDLNVVRGTLGESKGWNNKMFVRSDACKHHIRITNVRVERLQDISDEDCMAEGILHSDKYAMPYGIADSKASNGVFFYYSTPREAYAALIDRISGKGTWQSNPYVFVYEFELVK